MSQNVSSTNYCSPWKPIPWLNSALRGYARAWIRSSTYIPAIRWSERKRRNGNRIYTWSRIGESFVLRYLANGSNTARGFTRRTIFSTLHNLYDIQCYGARSIAKLRRQRLNYFNWCCFDRVSRLAGYQLTRAAVFTGPIPVIITDSVGNILSVNHLRDYRSFENRIGSILQLQEVFFIPEVPSR